MIMLGIYLDLTEPPVFVCDDIDVAVQRALEEWNQSQRLVWVLDDKAHIHAYVDKAVVTRFD